MQPLLSVMHSPEEGLKLGILPALALRYERGDGFDHFGIVLGNDFLERGDIVIEIDKNLLRLFRAGLLGVLLKQPAQPVNVLPLGERGHDEAGFIEAGVEIVVFVQHIDHAAGHARREVFARGAEDDGDAAGHVLTAVVAHALDDGGRAGVAHAEALARDAGDECAAGGGAIERDIADNDVFIGPEGAALRREDDELAAGEALAEAVVAVALEAEREALRDERGRGRCSRHPIPACPSSWF